MKIINYISKETKMISDAQFDGKFEFPIIANQEIILPLDIVPFEKRKKWEKKIRKWPTYIFIWKMKSLKNFLIILKSMLRN